MTACALDAYATRGRLPDCTVQARGTVTGADPQNPQSAPWFDIRLLFEDGGRIDVLAVVRSGVLAIEDAQADPPLALDALPALTRLIEGPLREACHPALPRTPDAAPGMSPAPHTAPASGPTPGAHPPVPAAPAHGVADRAPAAPAGRNGRDAAGGPPDGTGRTVPSSGPEAEGAPDAALQDLPGRLPAEPVPGEDALPAALPESPAPGTRGAEPVGAPAAHVGGGQDAARGAAPTPAVATSVPPLPSGPAVPAGADPLCDPAGEAAAPARRRARGSVPRGAAGRRFGGAVYLAAQEAGEDPVLAVMAATGLSRRRALRLIAGARDDGHLPSRNHRR